MRLRRCKKRKLSNILIVIFISLFISIFLLLNFIKKEIIPKIMNYAEKQAVKITELVISKSLSDTVINEIDMDKLFIIEKNNNNEIEQVDLNSVIVNKVLQVANEVAEQNFKDAEEGNLKNFNFEKISYDVYIKEDNNNGIVFQISPFAFLNNPVLSNIGPQIPIKLDFIGYVSTNIKTEVKEYGINNALITVYIHIEGTVQVNMPVRTNNIVVTQDVPLMYKIISGKVPNYYNNGLSSSSLSVPLNKN